jgi:hypothetical protein
MSKKIKAPAQRDDMIMSYLRTFFESALVRGSSIRALAVLFSANKLEDVKVIFK